MHKTAAQSSNGQPTGGGDDVLNARRWQRILGNYSTPNRLRSIAELAITALPYAASPVVRTLCSLTDQGPPCEHDHAPDAAASTATRPNVRDDGQRPSTGTGWREL